MHKDVLTLEEVVERVEKARKIGLKIVTTNGCFDILHYGHVDCLEKAKQFGDMLIVGINSDESVRRLKGESRPVNKAEHRASVIAALKPVDAAFIFYTDNPISFLKAIQPDVHVKGGDYSGRIIEQDTIESFGGKVCFIPLVEGLSTTNICKKIANT